MRLAKLTLSGFKSFADHTEFHFDEPIIVDSCGAQRLENGNIVFTSYGAKGDQVKLFEVTRQKKVVWRYRDGKPFGIHTFQVLAEGGRALPGKAWK